MDFNPDKSREQKRHSICVNIYYVHEGNLLVFLFRIIHLYKEHNLNENRKNKRIYTNGTSIHVSRETLEISSVIEVTSQRLARQEEEPSCSKEKRNPKIILFVSIFAGKQT